MGMSPMERQEETRRSPKLIRVILQWLNNLLRSHAVRAEKILAGFYDVDCELFQKPWNADDEKNLQSTKEAINIGEFSINKQVDTRLMAQVVLDFLENLVEPAISEMTVQKLSVLVGQGMKSREILTNVLENHGSIGVLEKVQPISTTRVNKNELSLLNCFKEFFSEISMFTGNTVDGVYLDGAVDRYSFALQRIIVALLMFKRKLPEFFGGRNMIYESRSITRVKRAKELRAVLAMWINDQEGVDKHVKVDTVSSRS